LLNPSTNPVLLAGEMRKLNMTITIDASQAAALPKDCLSGTARTNVIDRWIYVFTAASFIGIVLAGFVPDSLGKLAAIQAGHRPPFPLILHVHAVLMGSFLLLLLGQSILMALGKRNWHMQLGIAAVVLFPALVIAAIVLVPTMYRQVWIAAQSAPPPIKQSLQANLSLLEDILLIQLRVGVLFSILMWIALRSRTRDTELHKRLIFLASALPIVAAFRRMEWLPNTLPHSALTLDIYSLLALSPMFIWDLTRNRGIHRAYLIFAALFIPMSAVLYSLWDTPWWHATARHIMGI